MTFIRKFFHELAWRIKKSKKKISKASKTSTSKTKIKNVFYRVMLDILILQKSIQKKLEKLIKNMLSILLIKKKLHKKIKSLLVILIMMALSFPCKKKILARLRWKTVFASMCLVMKMSWFTNLPFTSKIWRLSEFVTCNW